MKIEPVRAFSAYALSAMFVLALSEPEIAVGASGSWTNNAAGNWSTTNNWAGGIVADGGESTGWFTNNITAARTITIDTVSRTLGILNIGDADYTNSFTIAASGGARLTLANGSINAQINQIATSSSNTISAPIGLSNSTDIANASTNLLTVSGTITSTVAGVRTLANAGTGSGGVTISGIIGNGTGTMALVQNSGSSLLTLSGVNTFTGGLFIKSGTVRGLTSVNAFGANSSVITIGDTTGSANATLNGGLAGTFANPIVVASNNTGIATITDTAASIFSNTVTLYSHDLTLAAAGSTLTLSGGITGTGNLVLAAGGAGAITLSTLAINPTGTITNSGVGSGLTTISGGVGSNVTAITEASTNSALVFSSLLTVNSAGTTLANLNPAGAKVLTVSGGVRGIGDLVLKNNSSVPDGITILTAAITNLGRIVNSGTGTGSTLISAVIGAPVTGVVQDSATSRLVLSGANTFLAGTTIDSGTLLVSNATGSATGPGAVNVNNGGTLQGIGTMAGTVTNNHGGMLSPGLDGIPGGTLTVGSLVWKGGGIVNCEIANVPLLDAAAGVDYDQILVTNTLTAVPGGSNLVIRLDSLNQTLAFDPARNYSLKVITCGAGATLNPTNVTLDTNAFLVDGTWSVTNLNNAIYVVYRGDTSPGKNYWRGTGNWSTATNWSLGHVPLAGEEVEFDLLGAANCSVDVVSNNPGSVTLAAGYTGTVSVLTKYPGQGTFTNFTIAGDCLLNGGALSHLINATSEINRLALTVEGNLTVNPGGQINTDGRGYSSQNGPGFAGGNSGSGHGGVGGIRAGGLGTTYGSITAPTNLGSGGGTYASMRGGGAVILTVGGSSTINGSISASATNSNPGADLYDAPSGGSIFLITGSLTGGGTIRANGGAGDNLSSGGGGRIAVILTNSMDFNTIKMETVAGRKMNGSMGGGGAGGTIYLQHTNHMPSQGKLVVNYNNNIPGTDPRTATLQNGMAASSNMFSEIILTNGGVYAVDTNDMLTLPSVTTIQGDPINNTDGIYLQGGTLNVPSPFSMSSNYFIGISASNATFNPVPSLTVRTNEVLIVNAPFILNYPLTIAPGGLLTHTTNFTTEAYKVDLTVHGDLNIQTGGQINVDGNGYVNAYGPGKFVSGSAGGGHGGLGGKRNSTDMGGTTYGSIVAPTNLGSGGGYGGAYGGGAVRLNVTGATIVNGVISANARNELYSGSGGSVFLTTGTLEGNGIIRASSPKGSWALGGAGRVAVILTNGADFGSVSIQACSGLGSIGTFMHGGAGTVYLQAMTQSAGGGTLWINATNMVNTHATVISSNVTGTVVGSLVITNGAVLQIESNQTLTVNGSWLNVSKPVNVAYTNWTVSFTSAPNSTVFLASTNDATMAGTNVFFNLSCTSAVKTVRFTAGTTNTVLGQLALGGGATLLSTSNGSQWYLTLVPGGTQQIGVVTVKDSHAGGGQQLRAGRGSANLGNNVHWLFPSGTLILIR